MPQLRQYPEVTSIEPTDGVWLDRVGAGTVWTELSVLNPVNDNIITPEQYGAVGDGTTDDTAAFARAILTGLTIVGRYGSTYAVTNLVNPHSIIDLNGSVMIPNVGADWCVKLTGQGAVIRNGYVNDSALRTLYATTTTATITGNSNANTAIGTPKSFTVASTTHLAAGKLIAITQTNGRHFVTKITSVVGSTVTIPDTPFGNVGSGAVVETAHGLIMTDQNLNGRVENITMPVCPVGIELISTVVPALGHEQTISGIRFDAYYLCAIFRDVNIATAHFINIVGYGHAGAGNGYVGYYGDGRNPGLYPSGGNEHTDVNLELAERSWQLYGCQLDEFHNCVGDTSSYHGWLLADVCQKMRFTNVWAGFITGTGGIGFQVAGGCLGIFLNGLYTRINDTADLSIDPASQVYQLDETWGESQTFTGGGTYNQVFPTHLGGSPGTESLKVLNKGGSQVNRWEMTGNVTGVGVIMNANGSDTNIPTFFIAKGAANLNFQNGGLGGPATQFVIGGPAAAVNYIQINGVATGSGPTVSVQGSDTNAGLFLVTRGTGHLIVQNNAAGTPATLMDISGPTDAAAYVLIGAQASGGIGFVSTNTGDLGLTSATGVIKFAGAGSFSANGSVATVLGSIGPVGSHTTVQEWLTFKDSGGTTRYVPCF